MNKATGFAALLLICIVGQTDCTCVLESDFGFIVNCNFKKSGLFRVRNLGGLKAHFGLGFSLGDELGFAESLGNLEANKRRSLNLKTGASDIGVLPAANMVTTPIMPVKRVVQPLRQPEARKVEIPKMTIAAPLPLGVPAFKPIPLVKTDEGINKFLNQAMTLRQSLNADPYFAGPNSAVPLKTTPLRMVSVAQPKNNYPVYVPNTISRVFTESNTPTRVNDIQAMVSPLAHEFVAPHKNVERRHYNVTDSGPPKVDLKGHTVEELAEAANVTVAEIRAAIAKKQAILDDEYYSRQASNFVVPTEPASAEFTFDSQELLSLASSTARPRTKAPPSKYHITSNSGQKVMNAPKEYYPEGYDKNFDDNFTSRVDLPHTSFHCGDQKHFPGLYADEDLNCMVFHVCALTDDGLVMKSFLCPESTLFDQSILKCNWWFYVDCKTSKKLYDSNRPVSKSYQLVKALTYFSKKDNGSQQDLENTVPDTFDTGKK